MALLALLIPFVLLGVVLALGRYEDAVLPPVPQAESEVAEGPVPSR